jgi:hypothetical protein
MKTFAGSLVIPEPMALATGLDFAPVWRMSPEVVAYGSGCTP